MSALSVRNSHGIKELKPKRRWRRRLLRMFMVLLLLAFAGHWQWGRHEEQRLERQLAALRTRGEPVLPIDFMEPLAGIAPGQNGALELLAADELIHRNASWRPGVWEDVPDLPLSCGENYELDVFMDSPWVAQALARINAARRAAHVYWHRNFDDPLASSPWPTREELTRLLVATAFDAKRRGEDAAAVERLSDALWVADAVHRAPHARAHRTATYMTRVACDGLLAMSPRLRVGTSNGAVEPTEIRRLIEYLLDDRRPTERFTRALRAERLAHSSKASAFGRGEIHLTDDRGNKYEGATPLLGRLVKPVAAADAVLILDHMTSLIAAVEGARVKSDVLFQPCSLRWPREVEQNRVRHVVAAMILPYYECDVDAHFAAATLRHLTATALALRWYGVEHDGSLPTQLDELVPRYLPAVPSDPLNWRGGTLRYRDDPAGAILYSAGKDNTDDDGRREWVGRRYGGEPTASSAVRWRTKDVVVDVTPVRPVPKR